MQWATRTGLSLLVACLWWSCTTPPGQPAAGPGETRTGLGHAVAGELARWLPERLAALEVHGAAAAVVGRNGTTWERVWGMTGAPDSPPVTPDTLFCIRSISKSVTALAVLRAAQDGLLDLDAPLVEYLPEFTVHSRFDEHPEQLITLRHMLSHWAGFTHDPPPGIDLSRSDYFADYIARISNTWLRFPVGYRHQYSNYGYDLAAHVIQARTRMPFAEYVRQMVLLPLGMTRSTFDLEIAQHSENRASGHDTRGHVVPLPFPEIASAGLYSSIRDMARYVLFHLNGRNLDGRPLLREDLMEQYHSIQFAAPGQRTGYCMGLIRQVVSTTFCLYHEGGGHGFGAHLMLYPELGIGVVLMTNREYHGLTGPQARSIMNGPIIEDRGQTPSPDLDTKGMRELGSDDPRLQELLGRYGDSPGEVLALRGGVLGLRTSDGSFHPVTFSEENGQLVGRFARTREARFLPPYGGRPGAMMIVNLTTGNSNSHYHDFNDSPRDPPGPDRPEWQRHVGQYDVLWAGEPFATVAITTRNGYLYYRDGKCHETEPGLFFLYDGETLDFRISPPTYANLQLRRR